MSGAYERACGKLGIERKDRSDHMWWNQDRSTAGPLRDTHRWDYAFIPSSWGHLPFTWHSMTRNLHVRPCDAPDVPVPLRHYLASTRVKQLSTEASILRREANEAHEERSYRRQWPTSRRRMPGVVTTRIGPPLRHLPFTHVQTYSS